eukprot:364494-Chlamydomonas_euryale.AAC.5
MAVETVVAPRRRRWRWRDRAGVLGRRRHRDAVCVRRHACSAELVQVALQRSRGAQGRPRRSRRGGCGANRGNAPHTSPSMQEVLLVLVLVAARME